MWIVKPVAASLPRAPPPSDSSTLPECCEVSRQLVGYAVLAHAALHSRQPALAQQYLSKAEKFFTARSLIGIEIETKEGKRERKRRGGRKVKGEEV